MQINVGISASHPTILYKKCYTFFSGGDVILVDTAGFNPDRRFL